MSTRLPEEIVPDNDQTRARRQHLSEIQELVGNAYPNKFDRSHLTKSKEREDTISSIIAQFKNHEPKPEPDGRPTPEQLEAANATLNAVGTVKVSGRLATPPRVMGKAAFVHLSDGEERLQIYVRKQEAVAVSNDSLQPVEEPESGWKLFQLLDHGDFVGVKGKLFVTKTGELSVHVEAIQFLSKALLPMPDKLHGISDPEIRQRQRYADLIASSLKVKTDDDGSPHELSTREVFQRRSKLITAMRCHLDDHGYVEVETPILSPLASGAAARPFETYHNALDIKLYARIAPELYLKRLVVGGFERVYELNRNFRNEGISYKHNPEFTMLEFYCAYMDAQGMMDFCEKMLRKTVQSATGGTSVRFGERAIDFGGTFERQTMKEAILKNWNEAYTRRYWKVEFTEAAIEDFNEDTLNDAEKLDAYARFLRVLPNLPGAATEEFWNNPEELAHACAKAWQRVDEGAWPDKDFKSEASKARNIELLFSSVAEEKLINPTFIVDFPKEISPLSKASPDDPAIAERFELYVAGMEVANGFSELNDPAEQLERFEEQSRQREGGDEEAMQTDLDYVRALSYGMPPAAGIGIGIDRLTMLLTNRRSIRDVILFPHMRPRQATQADDEPDSDS